MPPEKIHIPEVIEPDEKLPRDLLALRRLAYLMDEAVAIPGTKWRAGLDAALGFIPGIGDFVTGVLGTWIIVGGLRHHVPFRKVMQMTLNVLMDVATGAVPVLGDIFDIAYQSNKRNMRILEQSRDRRRPPRSYGSIAVAGFAILLLILGFAFVVFFLLVAGVLWLIGQRSP